VAQVLDRESTSGLSRRRAWSVWLTAFAAAGAAAAVWVTFSSIVGSQALVFALGIGIGSGYAASWWARSGGRRPALAALVATAVVLPIALYYINRMAFIDFEGRNGRRLSVPLRPPWNWFSHVLIRAYGRWIMHYPYTVGALLAAVLCGHRGVGVVASSAMPPRSSPQEG
jgi:alpha-beta hydrolase superfamily lysophospholipase